MILKFVLLIVGVVLILFLMTRFARTNDGDSVQAKPKEKIPNDKIVIIKGAKVLDVTQAIQQFCNLYNSQELSTVVTVSELANGDVVVTFPYDIDFGRFCFFVNFMHYPKVPLIKTDIRGWATTKVNDMWIMPEIAGKKVMLYIPDSNTEYDSLYLVSENNISYRIAFADSKDPQIINSPKMAFEMQGLGVEEIRNAITEEIS
jgi:hypothetical protein